MPLALCSNTVHLSIQCHTRSSEAEHATQRAEQQVQVRKWLQAHYPGCSLADMQPVLLSASARALGSEGVAAHSSAAAAGCPLGPTAVPLLSSATKAPSLPQSGSSTSNGGGAKLLAQELDHNMTRAMEIARGEVSIVTILWGSMCAVYGPDG